MVKALAIALAITIALLIMSIKMVMIYHEESVTANANVISLTQSLKEANIILIKNNASCKVTDEVVNTAVSSNNSLRDKTESLLNTLDKIQSNRIKPLVTKEVEVEKVIHSDRLTPSLYSLLQQSYRETSGDTSPCTTNSPAK